MRRTLAPCLLVLLPVALAGCDRASAPPPAAAPTAAPAPAEPAPAPAPAATPASDGTLTGGPSRARATIAGLGGNAASGELGFERASAGVAISGSLRSLESSKGHALHVHEGTDCAAPGEHFNPGGQPHGDPHGASHHAGDLPNQTSGDDGSATVNEQLDGVTLGDGGTLDILGRVVIVHAQADDYSTQPSGNSGDPIACGKIEAAP